MLLLILINSLLEINIPNRKISKIGAERMRLIREDETTEERTLCLEEQQQRQRFVGEAESAK